MQGFTENPPIALLATIDPQRKIRNMECTLKRCAAEATTTVILDRPESQAARKDYAWTGHHETAYCAAHAIARPDAEGIERYGDVWTMRPFATV